MKITLNDLAIMGGPKEFDLPLPVGQINIPSWESFEASFSAIFDRAYYTNHGVLAQQFEEKLCQLLHVRHAVTVTNATVGLSLACKALDLPVGGKVIVPAFTFAATVQALTWAGLEPVFCDVDPFTHCITTKNVAPLISRPGVCAILGVHLWGNPCDIEGLQKLAQAHSIPIFYDAAHAVGCTHCGQSFGNFGSCEVFSFHATKILSATEGGCIATNNDALAEKLRNLRSSYGRRATVPIELSANGRFSELQAAFGLLSIEEFLKNCAANKQRMEQYIDALHDVPGIRFIMPSASEKHNYQYVVLEIDRHAYGLDRDTLVTLLEAENVLVRRYFVPGMHKCPPYCTMLPSFLEQLPNTDALCSKVMQVPSGYLITNSDIDKICALIRFFYKNAHGLLDINK